MVIYEPRIRLNDKAVDGVRPKARTKDSACLGDGAYVAK